MRRACFCAAVWFVSFGAATAVQGAANLLSNANFDTDLTGWFAGGIGTAEWTSDDAGGVPTSGSAHVVSPGPGLAAIDHDCIPIEGATTYAGRAWVRVNAGNHNTSLILAAYSTPDCFHSPGGYLGSQAATAIAEGTEQWEHLVGEVTTPAEAQSAVVSCSFGGNAVDAECDSVYLPEAAGGGDWALASLAGLAFARRRAACADA